MTIAPPSSPSPDQRRDDQEIDSANDQRGASRYIGRYIVLREIASGGMGLVVEAVDPELARKVAIKVWHAPPQTAANRAPGEVERGRMVQEAKLLAKLSHENIVSIFDVGTLNNRAIFIAMEFIQGSTFREIIAKKDGIWRERVQLVMQASEGLRAAHEAGILHRDFKPENMIVTPEKRVRVLDFGLAKSLEGRNTDFSKGGTPVSGLAAQPTHAVQSSAIAGTPAYMAPEQILGEKLDARTDVFALGVVMFEAACLFRPFAADTMEKRGKLIERGQIEWPDHVPAWFRRVLRRALAHSMAQRFASVRELQEAMRAGFALERARRVRLSLGALIATVSVVAGAAWLQWPQSSTRDRCDSSVTRVETIWNREIRERIRRGFMAHDLVNSEQLFDHSAATLDLWLVQWRESARRLCSLETDQPSSDLSASIPAHQAWACLAESDAQVSALLQVWVAPTLPHVLAANEALASLDKPINCLDVSLLKRRRPMPADPDGRLRVHKLFSALKGAAKFIDLADFSRANEQLASVGKSLEENWDLNVWAELENLKGRLRHREENRGPASALALQHAILSSIAANDEENSAQRSEDLWFARVYLGNQIGDSEDILASMTSYVGRAENPPFLRYGLSRTQGIWTSMHGDYGQALTIFERSRRAAVQAFGPESLQAASAWDALGVTAILLDRNADAVSFYERALAIRKRQLPIGHPDRSRTYFQASVATEREGNYSAAKSLLRLGLGECLHSGLPETMCGELMGFAFRNAQASGDLSLALEVACRSAELEASQSRRFQRAGMWSLQGAGEILAQRGEGQAARELAYRGFALLRNEGGIHPGALLEGFIMLARLELGLEDFTAAQELLDQARAALDGPNESSNQLLQSWKLVQAELNLKLGRADLSLAQIEELLTHQLDNASQQPLLPESYRLYAVILLHFRALETAELYAKLALEEHEKRSGLAPHLRQPFREALAEIALAQGRTDDVFAQVHLAWSEFDATQQLAISRAPLLFLVARATSILAFSANASPNDALELANEASQLIRQGDPVLPVSLGRIQAWSKSVRRNAPRYR
jgi:serine/threonine-protein kinase